jgi:hypothetical protein
VIRDAVLHLLNDQPMLVDVFETPQPSDTVLICTNLRTMSRTRPLFADRLESTFVFPYAQIRFVELRTGATATEPAETVVALETVDPEPDLEVDEEFLRRVRDS